ncbi:hypothetical protein AVEN_92013-1 [Araneus ventricosus]|uniref:Uncharacterized protein n=1 Tax=Araneus ventricosus TaxID=182803 RepID=A0A4Y2FMT9_ARAVE|nr:hypothetical protein AVEN_92013-1 [Araneus ventricosus]
MYGSNMTAPIRIRFQTLNIWRHSKTNGDIPESSHRVWWFRRVPPRSPDLTPLDFFLWRDIKEHVYATPPPILQDLRRSITDACASVTLANCTMCSEKSSP